MFKLGAEMAKWSRVSQLYGRLVYHATTNTCAPPCINSQCSNVQQIIFKRFTSRSTLPEPTPTSSPHGNNVTAATEEIYSGPLSRKINFLKIMTLSTSLGTLFLLKDLHSRIEFPNQVVMVIGVGVLLLFNFLTPLLINLISKKYCVKMYYDHSRKQYMAQIYTFMFKKKTIVFTPEDVVVPSVTKFFTVAFVKNHPMFFDANHFKTVDYYKNIMGYDKPIDFGFDKKHKD
ncbi:transmembrane protein 70 homolog, mitochondrial [Planococcus citri]|uniref:transmembrane protein 70 homolog, mitochondrial n=1 Tax=Planococcus citri TaxID=170843 RepID=UPI0031F85C0E